MANMGVMVGVPHLARTIEPKQLKSTALDTGDAYDEARRQALDFARGNIRLPGTRELDPVVILQVVDADGKVLFTQGEPERRQVVDAGSVWLVHSIISDCTSRFIIWGCGGSNNDLGLDAFVDGVRIPGGAKTGTQQGPKNAVDTLETWMNGYSRYAATALWVGNATNELVRDGPAADYAAANTTVKLFKNWMGEYHSYLKRNGVFDAPANFDALRPKNVTQREIESPTTEHGMPGGCDQKVTAWVRTDVTYAPECEEKEIDTRNGLLASDQTPSQYRAMRKFVKLPTLKPELAVELAKEKNIAIAPTERSTGQVAVSISSPTNGKTVTGRTQVVGSVKTSQLVSWKVEIGEGAGPTAWKQIGAGNNNVSDAVLGQFDTKDFKDGVYTIRLTADDKVIRNLQVTVSINVRRGGGGALPTSPPAGATPTSTPP
jgi:membrane peptidoglycan carboxypeptidase